AINLCRATFTSRKRLSTSVIGVSIMPGLIMDIAAPARQPIAANLVAHRAQADSQEFGSLGTVSSGGIERHLGELALHIFERYARPQVIITVALIFPQTRLRSSPPRSSQPPAHPTQHPPGL